MKSLAVGLTYMLCPAICWLDEYSQETRLYCLLRSSFYGWTLRPEEADARRLVLYIKDLDNISMYSGHFFTRWQTSFRLYIRVEERCIETARDRGLSDDLGKGTDSTHPNSPSPHGIVRTKNMN